MESEFRHGGIPEMSSSVPSQFKMVRSVIMAAEMHDAMSDIAERSWERGRYPMPSVKHIAMPTEIYISRTLVVKRTKSVEGAKGEPAPIQELELLQ